MLSAFSSDSQKVVTKFVAEGIRVTPRTSMLLSIFDISFIFNLIVFSMNLLSSNAAQPATWAK